MMLHECLESLVGGGWEALKWGGGVIKEGHQPSFWMRVDIHLIIYFIDKDYLVQVDLSVNDFSIKMQRNPNNIRYKNTIPQYVNTAYLASALGT